MLLRETRQHYWYVKNIEDSTEKEEIYHFYIKKEIMIKKEDSCPVGWKYWSSNIYFNDWKWINELIILIFIGYIAMHWKQQFYYIPIQFHEDFKPGDMSSLEECLSIFLLVKLTPCWPNQILDGSPPVSCLINLMKCWPEIICTLYRTSAMVGHNKSLPD